MQSVIVERKSWQTAIRLFPLIFLIHDSEELLFVENWTLQHREALLERFGPIASAFSWSTPVFAAVVAVLFALAWCISAAAAGNGSSVKIRRLFVIVVTVLFVNVFTHLTQSLLLRTYTPGVVTAVIVALPYCLYVFSRLRRDGWHS